MNKTKEKYESAHYNRTSITSLKIHHPADNKETDSVFYCTVRSLKKRTIDSSLFSDRRLKQP